MCMVVLSALYWEIEHYVKLIFWYFCMLLARIVMKYWKMIEGAISVDAKSLLVFCLTAYFILPKAFKIKIMKTLTLIVWYESSLITVASSTLFPIIALKEEGIENDDCFFGIFQRYNQEYEVT